MSEQQQQQHNFSFEYVYTHHRMSINENNNSRHHQIDEVYALIKIPNDGYARFFLFFFLQCFQEAKKNQFILILFEYQKMSGATSILLCIHNLCVCVLMYKNEN